MCSSRTPTDWLLGPDAMTLVWLSPALGDDGRQPGCAATVGPFGRGALLALARSVGWLLMYVDLSWVLAHRSPRGMCGTRSSGIDGSRTGHRPRTSAAMVSFRIAGWDAVQAAEELSRSVFAILDADAERDLLRVSVGAWNREDELDRFIERVAELAAATPETLTAPAVADRPQRRRRTLTT